MAEKRSRRSSNALLIARRHHRARVCSRSTRSRHRGAAIRQMSPYAKGITNRTAGIPMTRPDTIEMAKGRCVSLPMLCESAAGTSPSAASAVGNKTGRKASPAPRMRGSPSPSSRASSTREPKMTPERTICPTSAVQPSGMQPTALLTEKFWSSAFAWRAVDSGTRRPRSDTFPRAT